MLTTLVTRTVFSGARAFELLTPEEQEFALNTTVTYAPQAYEYIRQCKASEDGLTIPTFGNEVPIDQLSEWSWDKVAEHPVSINRPQSGFRNTSIYKVTNSETQMVWRNPLNEFRPFLQVHGCCVFKLTTRDPHTGEVTVIDDVEEVRRIVYKMQSKIYAAERLYAHRWVAGDLCIFHNRGTMHSITGQLEQHAEEDKKRLMWQCTMTSNAAPEPFRSYPGVNATGFVRV